SSMNRGLAAIGDDLSIRGESGGRECGEVRRHLACPDPAGNGCRMLSRERDAAVAGGHVCAGTLRGFVVDGESVRRHDAQRCPRANHAYVLERRKAPDRPRGDGTIDRGSHHVVVASLFHRVADLNGAFVGLAQVVRGAAQWPGKAVGDDDLSLVGPPGNKHASLLSRFWIGQARRYVDFGCLEAAAWSVDSEYL